MEGNPGRQGEVGETAGPVAVTPDSLTVDSSNLTQTTPNTCSMDAGITKELFHGLNTLSSLCAAISDRNPQPVGLFKRTDFVAAAPSDVQNIAMAVTSSNSLSVSVNKDVESLSGHGELEDPGDDCLMIANDSERRPAISMPDNSCGESADLKNSLCASNTPMNSVLHEGEISKNFQSDEHEQESSILLSQTCKPLSDSPVDAECSTGHIPVRVTDPQTKANITTHGIPLSVLAPPVNTADNTQSIHMPLQASDPPANTAESTQSVPLHVPKPPANTPVTTHSIPLHVTDDPLANTTTITAYNKPVHALDPPAKTAVSAKSTPDLLSTIAVTTNRLPLHVTDPPTNAAVSTHSIPLHVHVPNPLANTESVHIPESFVKTAGSTLSTGQNVHTSEPMWLTTGKSIVNIGAKHGITRAIQPVVESCRSVEEMVILNTSAVQSCLQPDIARNIAKSPDTTTLTSVVASKLMHTTFPDHHKTKVTEDSASSTRHQLLNDIDRSDFAGMSSASVSPICEVETLSKQVSVPATECQKTTAKEKALGDPVHVVNTVLTNRSTSAGNSINNSREPSPFQRMRSKSADVMPSHDFEESESVPNWTISDIEGSSKQWQHVRDNDDSLSGEEGALVIDMSAEEVSQKAKQHDNPTNLLLSGSQAKTSYNYRSTYKALVQQVQKLANEGIQLPATENVQKEPFFSLMDQQPLSVASQSAIVPERRASHSHLASNVIVIEPSGDADEDPSEPTGEGGEEPVRRNSTKSAEKSVRQRNMSPTASPSDRTTVWGIESVAPPLVAPSATPIQPIVVSPLLQQPKIGQKRRKRKQDVTLRHVPAEKRALKMAEAPAPRPTPAPARSSPVPGHPTQQAQSQSAVPSGSLQQNYMYLANPYNNHHHDQHGGYTNLQHTRHAHHAQWNREHMPLLPPVNATGLGSHSTHSTRMPPVNVNSLGSHPAQSAVRGGIPAPPLMPGLYSNGHPSYGVNVLRPQTTGQARHMVNPSIVYTTPTCTVYTPPTTRMAGSWGFQHNQIMRTPMMPIANNNSVAYQQHQHLMSLQQSSMMAGANNATGQQHAQPGVLVPNIGSVHRQVALPPPVNSPYLQHLMSQNIQTGKGQMMNIAHLPQLRYNNASLSTREEPRPVSLIRNVSPTVVGSGAKLPVIPMSHALNASSHPNAVSIAPISLGEHVENNKVPPNKTVHPHTVATAPAKNGKQTKKKKVPTATLR